MRQSKGNGYRWSVVTGVLLALLWGGGCSRDAVRILRIGHGLDRSHSVHRAMEYLGERLALKSGGRLRVIVYPSQQLGTERECLELLQVGSLAMTKVSAAVLEGFVPDYKVFSLPYLFRDDAHKFKVFEGEIGRRFLLSPRKYWLRGLCFYDAGSRSFYTKDRPVLTPDDLAGLKIRTQESATSVELVNALGGAATPIAWGELYTALQQGVVDGAENNPPSFFLSKHFEVCKYYSLDEHTSVPDVLLISTHWWERLSAAEQGWLEEAAQESYEYQKKLWQESSADALKAVAEAGVEIDHPDKEPFRGRAAGMLTGLDPKLRELVRQIEAVE